MKYFILITCLWMVQTPFAQISNTREMLVKNHVLTSTESHCFINSTGSCTVIFEKYDERGNCIESDMARLGTLYRDVFDDNNKVIMSLQIDKSDTTHIDTIQYQFDQHNQLTLFAAGHDTPTTEMNTTTKVC